MQDGYDFVWRAYNRSYFKLPEGRRIKLEVKDNVPFIPGNVKNAIPAISQCIPKVNSLPSAPIEVEDEVVVIDHERGFIFHYFIPSTRFALNKPKCMDVSLA